ncbi:MAG TPA: enolase C-terminal domain-like protein, partial [Candidatus Binataceae bacterium]|nr:enolase C-terminal domain-like protein [Candidatus Binataceae bacterium]
VHADSFCGLGYTYSSRAAAVLIQDIILPLIEHGDPMAIERHWDRMTRAIRNLGRPGISSMAIAAVDAALWDLKARLLNLPLAALLGKVRDAIPIYGSGGFTSYSDSELAEQLSGWAAQGIKRVKMKIGRDPARDEARVRIAREVIGPAVDLFVDANGAYSRKQALDFCARFAQLGVRWFEEPVSSDDLEGLRLIRDRADPGIDVAAGEYGFDPVYFRHMLEAGAVDVLQADATRCAGITGLQKVAALCESRSMPLSAHCAPALHLHPGCAMRSLRHLEYFHDHVRLENMLFDGLPAPHDGNLQPDLSRPGSGLEFKHADARKFRA